MKRWWAVAFAFFFCACLAAARITLAGDAPDTDNGDTSASEFYGNRLLRRSRSYPDGVKLIDRQCAEP